MIFRFSHYSHVIFRSPLFCFADLTETTGKLFSNMEEMAIDDAAKDSVLAKKLFIVDEYWSGLKSKEDILHKSKDDILQKPVEAAAAAAAS